MLTTLFISALSIYNVASSTCGDYNYAFVLDESGSVGFTNYQASIDFVIELIENDIKDTAQLTALAFNQNRDWIYHFSQTQLPRSNGANHIIDELIEEKSDFDGSTTGTRPAVEATIAEFQNAGFTQDNILILVTDGKPNTGGDPCDGSVINALDNNNIRVIIVGVGGFNPTSVECLVRGNTADIITIANFDFAPVVTQLQAGQVVCDDCDPCTPENIAAGKFHHPSCDSCCRFIQCDAWGNMYDMPCAAGTYWNADLVWPGQDHNMGQCTDPGCSFSPNYVVTDEYYLIAGSLAFDEAQAACAANGGNLASIHSQQDFDAVEALCDSYSSSSYTNCHIGMKYNYGTGKWYWIDGSARDFGFDVNGDANGQTPPWEGSWAWDAVENNSGCQIMDLNAGSGYFDDNYCLAQYPAICYGPPPPAPAKSVGTPNDLGDNIKQVEYPDIKYKNNNNNYSYYGTITLIGVIAFILINNVFIGCWCLRKNNNKVKFEMVGDEEI